MLMAESTIGLDIEAFPRVEPISLLVCRLSNEMSVSLWTKSVVRSKNNYLPTTAVDPCAR